MKTSISFPLALLVALVLPVFAHAQSIGLSGTTTSGSTVPTAVAGSATIVAHSGNAAAGEAIFRSLDKNNDGIISREEFMVGWSSGVIPGVTNAGSTTINSNTSSTGTSGTGTSGTGTSSAGTSGTGATSSSGTTGASSGAKGTQR